MYQLPIKKLEIRQPYLFPRYHKVLMSLVATRIPFELPIIPTLWKRNTVYMYTRIGSNRATAYTGSLLNFYEKRHSLNATNLDSVPILLGNDWQIVAMNTFHRFTYLKGVHSYRYFLPSNSYVICSCIYAFCPRIATPWCTHWLSNCYKDAYMHEQITKRKY